MASVSRYSNTLVFRSTVYFEESTAGGILFTWTCMLVLCAAEGQTVNLMNYKTSHKSFVDAKFLV